MQLSTFQNFSVGNQTENRRWMFWYNVFNQHAMAIFLQSKITLPAFSVGF